MVLIGGAFGSQGRLPLPSADPERKQETTTALHGFLTNTAKNHPPIRLTPVQVWSLAFLAAFATSAAILQCAASLRTYPERVANRTLFYASVIFATAGSVLIGLVAAAKWPEIVWIAGLLALVIGASALRSLVSAIEFLLVGRFFAPSVKRLWRAATTEKDKSTPALHLARVLVEASLMVGLLAVAYYAVPPEHFDQ